jgi:hypothetical protein
MSGLVRLAVACAIAVAALAAAGNVAAHEGGKAQPRISASLEQRPGLQGEILVGLTDVDSGDVIRRAEVTVYAEMTRPHVMRTQRVRLPERSPGMYSGRLQFLMRGAWTVHIAAGGTDVVDATAKLETRVRLAESESDPTPPVPGDGGRAAAEVLPTTLEDDLTRNDGARMVSLWLHSVAALGWIVGVLVMAVALSTRPGVLAETARVRLARGYTSWGAWLHWALVLVIVATGIYQMLYVTPFTLAYTPDDLARLAEIPYGLLYEAILIAKLALFGVLVITGTATLLRLVDPPLPVVPVTNPHPGFFRILASALGPAGVVYLLTVPLILGAAMSLRYVHVLAHVAEVVRTP